MPTVVELTDPYVVTYTPVPRVRPGVCDVCHGAPGAGFTTCWSCSVTTSQVSRPIRTVVPISLYELNSQMHHVLRKYKDGRYPATRLLFRQQIAALLTRFLQVHGDCIRDIVGSWDVVTSIPSSAGRAGPHPLDTAIRLSNYLRPQYEALLGAGEAALDHRRANDLGYVVIEDVTDLDVLLVDDTFTTGARIQSAASALSRAGANVAAAVPIGRVITPGFSEESKGLWDGARAIEYDFDVCCLE